MATQLVIDLETTSTEGNAGILGVAIAAYSEQDVGKSLKELEQTNTAFFKLDIKEQISKFNRKVSNDVMEWWQNQDSTAQKILKPSVDDISTLLLNDKLIEFCNKHGYNGDGFIWQRGSADIIWLDSLLSAAGVENDNKPIKWWKVRDIRTASDIITQNTNGYIPNMLNGLKAEFPEFVMHNPIHDVIQNVYQLRQLGLF